MNDVPCTYRISIKAIIHDATGRTLLLREKDGSWELPGGGLEHGENWREGLVRELSEETGMEVEQIGERPSAFWTIHKDVGSPILTWFAFIAYEVKTSGVFRKSPGNEEAEEAQYFDDAEIASLKLHNNTKPYFM